jgi:two-component system, OmpR family, phosphate regulon sensor histidine kinase PhoR
MPSDSSKSRPARPPVFSQVALKTAGTVAATGFLLALLLVPGSWAVATGVGVGVGIAAYVAVWSYITPRIHLAIHTLQDIRQHEFDNLDTAPRPNGDEMRDLVWEVFRTGQKLEAEIQDLKQMENYRREFIGNVSHELKTPIFSVQGFTETLLDGAVDDESVNRSFLRKIMRNVSRLDNLAQDLSDIARIETGELEMSAEPFNLVSLVHSVIESLEIKAADKDVTLAHRLPDDLPLVYGDRERIRQVLINLSDNAIKYNRGGGRVEIIARLLPSDEVKISVADDGLGIPPEHIPRLTERFYRVDRSRSRSQGGTGLGLAIVKHILSAHDRELMIESSPGSGSTFGFTLTAIQDAEATRSSSPSPEAARAS